MWLLGCRQTYTYNYGEDQQSLRFRWILESKYVATCTTVHLELVTSQFNSFDGIES